MFKKKLKDELTEKKPLPVGMTEFEDFVDRIGMGCMLPITRRSLRFTLANMIMHLGPTEAFKEDVYFINSLRKYAANQVADVVRQEEYAEKQKRAGEPEQPAVTPHKGNSDVLEVKKV